MKLRKERENRKSRKLPPQYGGGDGKRYRNGSSCTKSGEK
jgi:hypothetical protein